MEMREEDGDGRLLQWYLLQMWQCHDQDALPAQVSEQVAMVSIVNVAMSLIQAKAEAATRDVAMVSIANVAMSQCHTRDTERKL
jgi:hypothetical protein